METKPRNLTVLMPDDQLLEVTYYCNDKNLEEDQKEFFTSLLIQLDDCICNMKIEKHLCKNQGALERIIHNKVINTKGHLCQEN
ncbi:MAG: hypothetical protein ABI204_02635 [Ginsengibacter sp.]